MTYRKSRKGAAFLISMIVLAILSAWAVSICSISDAGVQLAENQREVNSTRVCAESGLGILRFWLNQVSMPGTTAASAKFSNVVTFLQNNLTANITSNYYDGSSLITVSPVTLDSTAGQTFSAKIIADDPLDAETLQMDVTGAYRTITRTIRVNYNFGPRINPLFDYGVATKGPLRLYGNIDMSGANVELDASVYIESENDANALSVVGNSSVAGDVYITNPDAVVTLQGGQASIGGETGQEAIDNHVNFNTPQTDFPVPNPGYFWPYVQNTYDPNNVLTEYENVRILAGTNPTFSAVILRGIIFIETPNIVTFTGNTEITGIIVGNGDLSDNSGTNQIKFSGTVNSYPVTNLPYEPQFDQLRNETGTFLLAPGFSASFLGDFETLSGAIAANGITFDGGAGGTIDGSVINYSDTPMTLKGSSDLFFNRSGTTEVPAGFDFDIELKYDPASYSEVLL